MTPAITGVKRAAEPDAVRTMLARQTVGRSSGVFSEHPYDVITDISSGITSGYTVVTPSYNTMSYSALALMAKTEGAQ